MDPCNNTQDKLLTFMIEWCSALIEEILNRPDLSKKTRTQYYLGNGTQKLLLRNRPVWNPQDMEVYVEQGGHFGATSGSFSPGTRLVYGNDYALVLDEYGETVSGVEVDARSRCGILLRVNGNWPKTLARQGGLLSPFLAADTGSIKITYTAGYTVDTLPMVFRLAMNLLIQRLRYIMPLGLELSSEHYEERSIANMNNQRRYLTSLIAPMILPYRNWKF